ncbi:hypothetical protein PCANC_23867 [Puccinia coronata f. sp. avenae]|uniref:tRNA (guanine(26)-N(2))-dimethyltransferase n=1 Tax=Puccinia coronata f. sp. avenae TaxID=200324 RepID=A0A2N5S234_9BASI|nr:hypothetical protein PCANC_23867 [Puccinia coronata f. sp. avenae]
MSHRRVTNQLRILRTSRISDRKLGHETNRHLIIQRRHMSTTTNMKTFPAPPTGYTAHQEASTQILIKCVDSEQQPAEAFINPVQEYNRDLSVAAIRAWSSLRNEELESKSLNRRKQQQQKRGGGGVNKRGSAQTPAGSQQPPEHHIHPTKKRKHSSLSTSPHPAAEQQQLEDAQHAITALSACQGNVGQEDVSGGLSATCLKEDEEGGGSVVDPPATAPAPAPELALAASAPARNQNTAQPGDDDDDESRSEAKPHEQTNGSHFQPQKFSLLEALSATGLRAIRYAKEIPSLKSIVANDLSPSAVKLIQANIAHNGLDAGDGGGKVRVTQGDACDLMYAHRAPSRQFDVVDLDPYGTAAPFIDAAIQSVRHGGLLCVTCTDLAVLAGSAYPEKCFSNYGGTSMRAEYSHEYALRQVVHTLASSGARYGRQVQPLLSLSIDFYVRIFVRVYDSAAEVKKSITNTAVVYVCSGCGQFHFQALGRAASKPTKKGTGGATAVSYQNAPGPPMPGPTCAECGGSFRIAGPLWSGPLHHLSFCQRLLDAIQPPSAPIDDPHHQPLKTVERIRGMVALAKAELEDAPFYFTPAKLSGLFRCSSPSLMTVGSGLLNAGFELSRSHCQPGSIKTNAPRAFLHDLMKTWIHEQWSASSHSAIRKEPAAAGGGGLGGSGEKADCKVEANETCDEQDAAGVQDGATQYLLDDGMAVDVAGVQQDDEAAVTSKDTGDSMASSSAEGSKVSPVTILEGCRVHLERNSNNAPLTRLLSVPTRFEVDLSYNKLVESRLNSSVKLVRYQTNPTPHWGPKARAGRK